MPSTIIAINDIPHKWTTNDLIKKLAKALMSDFVCLGFDKPANKSKNRTPKQIRNASKTFYIELPPSLEPYETIDKLNKQGIPHGIKNLTVKAFIPIEVPEAVWKFKPKTVPIQIKRFLHIRDELPPEKTIVVTYNEILVEMQCKYAELFNLSATTEHKLLQMIGEVIHGRLCEVMNATQNSNSFELSKNYRKSYPHSRDFELILSSYKQIVPDGYINKKELSTVTSHPYSIDQVPFDQVQTVCLKYSQIISAKVNEHLASLKTDIDLVTDTEEDIAMDIARKKVRAELKKLSPYMPAIVKQVVVENFIPRKSPYHRIRIYGEPFMPPRDTLQTIQKKFHAVKIFRSDRMFNLLLLKVPPAQYSNILALDGTSLSGATLIVRSSDMPNYVPALNKDEQQDYIGEYHDEEMLNKEYDMEGETEEYIDEQDY